MKVPDVPKAAPITDQTGRISVELQGLKSCRVQVPGQGTDQNIHVHADTPLLTSFPAHHSL